jgi:hypothetical protein
MHLNDDSFQFYPDIAGTSVDSPRPTLENPSYAWNAFVFCNKVTS